ncbi:hypothetical protein AGR6A_Lc90141 [Agrobacterium sp. NCPPB 925]|nr:hypothetical protein AGR6A_Lc90141 [Agrobacterium sp. NCPPB 925]
MPDLGKFSIALEVSASWDGVIAERPEMVSEDVAVWHLPVSAGYSFLRPVARGVRPSPW